MARKKYDNTMEELACNLVSIAACHCIRQNTLKKSKLLSQMRSISFPLLHVSWITRRAPAARGHPPESRLPCQRVVSAPLP